MLVDLVVGFQRSEDGPTVTEYAVLLGLIVAVCLVAISGIGQTVSAIFSSSASSLPTGSSS